MQQLPIGSLCDNSSFSGKKTEREYSGTISVAYQLTDDVNAYAGYSRGYKAGGFNLDQESLDPVTGDQTDFDPESADAYEVGLKASFLDNRVIVNSALFYTQWENFQLNTFTGLGFFITNLSEVTGRGIEVESSVALTDSVYATLGGTYAVTRFGNDLNCSVASTLDGTCLEGRRITHAPRWQGSASLFAERELPGTKWVGFANSNLSYRSDHNTGSNLNNLKKQPAIWLLNGQVGVRSADERWEAALWVTNLTDKRYNTVVFDSVFQGGSFSTFSAAPRMWG